MKIKEEDVIVYKASIEQRVNPDKAMVFMFGSLLWSSFIMFMNVGTLLKFGWERFPTFFEKIVLNIEIGLSIIQLLFFLFYLIPKMNYKFQKFQMIVVIFNCFQFATIGFSLLILPVWLSVTMDQRSLIYLSFLIVGSLILHLLITFETFKQAKEGAFKDNVSFFNKRKMKFISILGIYAFICLLLILFTNSYTGGTRLFITALTIILYAFAIGAAEFQFLAYCKFKFPSFHSTWKDRKRAQ